MGDRRTAIVIGAGPAGLVAALSLLDAGFSVRVFEKTGALPDRGSGLTLWPNGMRALESVGAAAAVRSVSTAAPGMAMSNWKGRVLSLVSGEELDSVGGRGLALHRADLVRSLAQLLPPETVEYGRKCVGTYTDGARGGVRIADGTVAEADLVVGADGIRSRVRTSAGLGNELRPGGFRVWRGTTTYSLEPFPGLLSFGGSRQFGLWQLPGERVYWFASAPAHEPINDVDPPPASEFMSWHHPIPDVVRTTPTAEISATDIYDSEPLPRWSSGIVTLVGDAAHPSMPNMGQGTSQAFEDAVALARSLRETPRIHRALAIYQERRWKRATAAWSQARQLAAVGNWHNPVACLLRDTMLRVMPQALQLRQLETLFRFQLAPGHP